MAPPINNRVSLSFFLSCSGESLPFPLGSLQESPVLFFLGPHRVCIKSDHPKYTLQIPQNPCSHFRLGWCTHPNSRRLLVLHERLPRRHISWCLLPACGVAPVPAGTSCLCVVCVRVVVCVRGGCAYTHMHAHALRRSLGELV